MADCVFCMIAHHEIPTNAVYEDDKITVSYTHLTLPTKA